MLVSSVGQKVDFDVLDGAEARRVERALTGHVGRPAQRGGRP
jgi:hypothetical protein